MTDDELGKILWDYNLMHQPLEKADAIFVLGSSDTRVAAYAAELFLAGWAPLLIFSGHKGKLTEEWKESEATVFANIAIQTGVFKEHILLEPQSTNTSENILFTKALLEKEGISIRKIILVQKPYMERRVYATFKKRWPEPTAIVTSPQISFEEYPDQERPKDLMMHMLVGDTQRIKLYAEKDFLISQVMPDAVWDAYEELVKRGYTKLLVK